MTQENSSENVIDKDYMTYFDIDAKIRRELSDAYTNGRPCCVGVDHDYIMPGFRFHIIRFQGAVTTQVMNKEEFIKHLKVEPIFVSLYSATAWSGQKMRPNDGMLDGKYYPLQVEPKYYKEEVEWHYKKWKDETGATESKDWNIGPPPKPKFYPD